MAKHVHNYQLVRTVQKKGKTYYFYECLNPGCPQPNKMEIR